MLLEDLAGYQPKITQEKMDVIEHQCQPFIKKLGGLDNILKYPIYRGSSTNNLTQISNGLFYGKRRENRKPKTTDPEYHDFLNDQFKEKFGIPYRNGVFATGQSSDATFYGKVYQFFPIGEFRFCWSPVIHDLYQEIEKIQTNPEYASYDDHEVIIHDEAKKKLIAIVNTYKETNLVDAIRSKHEIMFFCDNYLMVE